MAKYEPSSVPNSMVVPRANAIAEIDEIDERTTRTNKLMEVISYRILEPKAIKGRMLREYCVIGSDDDLEAADPATWEASMGAVSYNQALRATGMRLKGDTEIDNEAAQGKTLGITINVSQDENGRDRNGISDHWKVGEREPELLTDGDKPKAASETKPAKPTKKAKPEPEEEEEEIEEEEDEIEEEEEEEEEPPRKPKKAAKKAPAKKAGKKPKTEMRPCPDCGESFPRSEIMDHIEECDGGDDD